MLGKLDGEGVGEIDGVALARLVGVAALGEGAEDEKLLGRLVGAALGKGEGTGDSELVG